MYLSCQCQVLICLKNNLLNIKESVLPKAVTKRVAIEAAASFGWERYVGTEGKTITIDHFGASAPGGLVLEKFGFTPENVVNTYKSL